MGDNCVQRTPKSNANLRDSVRRMEKGQTGGKKLKSEAITRTYLCHEPLQMDPMLSSAKFPPFDPAVTTQRALRVKSVLRDITLRDSVIEIGWLWLGARKNVGPTR